MRRTGEKLMQRQTLWFNVAAVAATLRSSTRIG
jgi:hypothetical protein